ncbi:MAG: ABC transporter ATP-binding protein [Vicinamibacteria bacterium]|jgi:ABC-type polysaccharide/polyol phosphate transport system ATPase subunit|nr:ABC transporter ATP-binding protein [Vicinamibacteria bacterium]
MPVIEVAHLRKAFRIPSVRRETLREHLMGALRPRTFERLQVLDDVSFAVERGETLGIMGRNGCGKSTLLKILAGIYRPDSGTVRVGAPLVPILDLGVGWNGELDAIDNILILGTVMGLGLREAQASVDEILAFADLARFAKLQLKHYSSGMAARLAYATAFQAVRDILVLDEIFAVGDQGFRLRCEARYRELHAAGHTIILVSHDPSLVAKFCDRALLIDQGRVIGDGPAGEVANSYWKLMEREPV